MYKGVHIRFNELPRELGMGEGTTIHATRCFTPVKKLFIVTVSKRNTYQRKIHDTNIGLGGL